IARVIVVSGTMLSSEQVLLKLLEVIQEQHDSEEEEPAKVAATTPTASTSAASFAETERREPTASIVQLRSLNLSFGVRSFDSRG
uniref:Uncharacterized protein n=2 Tax=Aegilops tauschii subsp. strangulata TaxID=200361 RepID=A0A453JI61_AEGTS